MPTFPDAGHSLRPCPTSDHVSSNDFLPVGSDPIRLHFPKLEAFRPEDDEAELRATALYKTPSAPQKVGGYLIVSADTNFVGMEENVLRKWTKEDTFQESLRESKGRKRYSFYDGPPFATGLPHYGHILAGTIKDIVTRYAHQLGFFVERRFGWDCHGLPVEYEIDKKLKISSKEDVFAMGVKKWESSNPGKPKPSERILWNIAIREYNAACRSIVMRYSSAWESQITRLGRWIDFKRDYKTMNVSFMESVWWVFKQLFDKGLVYQGIKVMPYSTACTTPLSNFEAKQNYKDVVDPAIVVSFPLVSDPDVSLLAWTTTPWTLPSNLALCVNEEMDYVKFRDAASGSIRVALKSRLSYLYPKKKGKKKGKGKAVSEAPYSIIEEFKGSKLVGLKYSPLFNYFLENKKYGAFRVLSDSYVQDDAGTGIVHQAPAFGEDDHRVCKAHGLVKKDATGLVCPIDDNGCFTQEVSDFKGLHVKAADKRIIKHLRDAGRIVKDENFNHSYPHCWRSDTPLIYRAVPSWFVNVEKIKAELIQNNKKTRWVPSEIGTGRFHNWLENARDWAISRNRYWGTPLPIWLNSQGEIRVFGSLDDLKKASGVNIQDIHRENVDLLEIPSQKKNGEPLRRISEVFDCWYAPVFHSFS